MFVSCYFDILDIRLNAVYQKDEIGLPRDLQRFYDDRSISRTHFHLLYIDIPYPLSLTLPLQCVFTITFTLGILNRSQSCILNREDSQLINELITSLAPKKQHSEQTKNTQRDDVILYR
jgi:hypothetical protein